MGERDGADADGVKEAGRHGGRFVMGDWLWLWREYEVGVERI